LAALLIGVANWHIFFGYWTVPTTLGATFVLIIVYLLLKLHKEKTTLAIPVCGLLMAALLFTHTIAALWLAALLFTLWLCLIAYNTLFKQKLATLTPIIVALVFTSAMFIWWTFGSGYMNTLAMLVEHGFNPDIGLSYMPGVTAPGVTAPGVTAPGVTAPFWETLSGAPSSEFLFNSLGMFLFFTISFVGCLYMFSRQFGNPYTFFMATAGILILGIGYFPMLRGMSVIEHRWWYMVEMLLSVPLAVAFCLVSGIFKKIRFKAAVMAASVFLLTFLMIMGLPSNMDNRTFSPNQLVRYAFTESELQALQTVSANSAKTIGVDGYYTAAGQTPELLKWSQDKLQDISGCLLARDFSQCHCNIILIRDEVVIHPFATGGGVIYRLNYDPRQFLTEQGFSKIYDCGSVSGFMR